MQVNDYCVGVILRGANVISNKNKVQLGLMGMSLDLQVFSHKQKATVKPDDGSRSCSSHFGMYLCTTTKHYG